VHETQPNAFSEPGGNAYVTDSMMTFVKNKEELAGVLCHEVSHDIHHDVYTCTKNSSAFHSTQRGCRCCSAAADE
jgi:Zn-dependent protease with chaperone function